LTLQTLPAVEADDRYAQVAKEAGVILQAGVAAQAWERDKLERLYRYISRPAVSEKRLSLTSAGNIRYELKTGYRDGTTHVAVLTHPCATRHSYAHAFHI
jgi:HSP90 family molecular chaperone